MTPYAIVTTGAYRANLLCDTAARWETAATGPGQPGTAQHAPEQVRAILQRVGSECPLVLQHPPPGVSRRSG